MMVVVSVIQGQESVSVLSFVHCNNIINNRRIYTVQN